MFSITACARERNAKPSYAAQANPVLFFLPPHPSQRRTRMEIHEKKSEALLVVYCDGTTRLHTGSCRMSLLFWSCFFFFICCPPLLQLKDTRNKRPYCSTSCVIFIPFLFSSLRASPVPLLYRKNKTNTPTVRLSWKQEALGAQPWQEANANTFRPAMFNIYPHLLKFCTSGIARQSVVRYVLLSRGRKHARN